MCCNTWFRFVYLLSFVCKCVFQFMLVVIFYVIYSASIPYYDVQILSHYWKLLTLTVFYSYILIIQGLCLQERSLNICLKMYVLFGFLWSDFGFVCKFVRLPSEQVLILCQNILCVLHLRIRFKRDCYLLSFSFYTWHLERTYSHFIFLTIFFHFQVAPRMF